MIDDIILTLCILFFFFGIPYIIYIIFSPQEGYLSVLMCWGFFLSILAACGVGLSTG
jgi:hypothetical protein